MKKKSKNIRIFGIIVLILLVLYILNYAGILGKMRGISTLEVVPIDCATGILCHESDSPFVCPSGVYGCKVKGYMECDIQQPEQSKVYFRTNADSFDDYDDSATWIAINGVPTGNAFTETDNLFGYCYSSTTTTTGTFVMYAPTNNRIGVYNSKINILSKYQDTQQTMPVYRVYEPCTTAVTDITPTEPYKSATNPKQELTEGAVNNYYCTSTLTYKDKTGGTKDSEQLIWDNPTSGGTSQSIKEYLLTSGESVELTGSGSRHYLKYSNLKQVETCNGKPTKCKADGTGTYVCVNDIVDYTQFTPCNTGEVCQDYFCTLPFSVKEASLAKSGYTSTESIQLRTKFISTTVPLGDVIINTWKFGGTTPEFTKTISNYDFRTTSQQPIYTELVNPNEQGSYYITVNLKYNNQVVPFIKAEDKLQFRIAPEVSCNLNLKGTDRSELLVNQPIIIELNTYQGEFGSDMDNISFAGTTLNTNTFTINKATCTSGTSGNAYTYTCQATSSVKGDLDVKATVTKSQVSATCSYSKTINEPKITVAWKDTTFICSLPGTKTFYFESKDPFGNYIDTTNTLMVIEPSTTKPIDRSSLIVRTDIGKYKFDYLLAEPLGGTGSAITYKFDVSGYSDTYKISATPISGTLEVRNDCSPTECITNTDCQNKYGANYLCYDGTCKEGNRPDYLIYAIIIGAIAVGILILVIIIYYAKKKKSSTMEI